jgi:hypothetical protein
MKKGINLKVPINLFITWALAAQKRAATGCLLYLFLTCLGKL